MNDIMKAISNAAETIRETLGTAEIGIVLGSGLGDYVQALSDPASLSYESVPGFPISTAPGHAGRWWSGMLHNKRVFMLQGRFHAYEGYSLQEVTMYVRIMKLLGVKTLILTNAAGCVNTNWRPGDLMIVTDCINYSGTNPLIGPNVDEMGPRFPDMSEAYSKKLISVCEKAAAKNEIDIRKGVYMWFSGPSYETPAEIRMARILGADAVGMSTVPETIVARHCGINVLGISCMTNMAAGILDQPLNHTEVMEAADRVKGTFRKLLDDTVAFI